MQPTVECKKQLLAINFILCLLDLALFCTILTDSYNMPSLLFLPLILMPTFCCCYHSPPILPPPTTFWLPTFTTNLDIVMPHNGILEFMHTRLR